MRGEGALEGGEEALGGGVVPPSWAVRRIYAYNIMKLN